MTIRNYTLFRMQDEGVQSLIRWQFREHGGFFMALWDAISRADLENLAKLEKAFPLHVEAYRRYTSVPGWWDTLLRALREEGKT